MSGRRDAPKLNRVEKRAVEALAVVPVIREVAERFGRDEALDILRRVNEREALERGREQARDAGPGGIDALVEEIDSWGEGGGWEMNVLERTATTYHFDVTRCPYHDLYRELGLAEYGVALSCCRDAPHARGFNPRLELARTKTLMEGADRCDFRYRLAPETARPGDREPQPGRNP